jgi:hypothetical protein
MNDREDSIRYVYEFHHSDYFDKIRPLAGAREALLRLKEKYELHVVTSRQQDIEPQTRRFVEKFFPDTFEDLHFGNHFGRTGAHVPKPEMCARIGAVALVDDSSTYCAECAAHGIRAILFGTYAWNSPTPPESSPLIQRARNWDDVLRALL